MNSVFTQLQKENPEHYGDPEPTSAPVPVVPQAPLDVYFIVKKIVLDDPLTTAPCRAETVPNIPPGLTTVTASYRFDPSVALAQDVPYVLKFWDRGICRFSQKIIFGIDVRVKAVEATVRRRNKSAGRTWLSIETPMGQVSYNSFSLWLGRTR